MGDVEIQLAQLGARLDAGFSAITGRFEDAKEEAQRRHEENITRLDRIEGEARRTNGRVTRHEEQIKVIDSRVAENTKRIPTDALTPKRIKDFALFVGWILAAVFWVLQLTGKL